MNRSQQDEGSQELVLEGYLAVQAALAGNVREIHRLLIDRTRATRRSTRLVADAKRQGIGVEQVDRAVIDRLTGRTSHGGIAAVVSERRFLSPNRLAEDLVRLESEQPPFVVMLDGIEDPYNLGFALRSLFAAGIDGVVLRQRSWGESEATILRSSAGAFDHARIALAESAESGAAPFRRQDFAIAATAQTERSRSLFEVEHRRPLFLLIGGERRGITRSFLDACDLVLHIPYGRQFDGSLGAAAAAAVIGFEFLRKRAVDPLP